MTGVRKRRKPSSGLQSIPGVGPSIAEDLRDLGYRDVPDLRRADPERMYARLIELRGCHQDPCVLYVFRCAVYFARTVRPDPELLKWWAWKDRTLAPTQPGGGSATALPGSAGEGTT